jgi:hypothetical protein
VEVKLDNEGERLKRTLKHVKCDFKVAWNDTIELIGKELTLKKN